MRQPPGPRRRDLLKALQELQKDPLSVLIETANDYGDFARLSLGPLKVYLVNHPDYIQHILQTNNRNYTKDTFQYNLLSTVTGNGLLTSDGDYWLRQRRLVQPAFHRQKIAAFGDVITAATLNMLKRWDVTHQENKALDIDAEMMRLTLEIIGKTLFNVDLSTEAESLAKAVLTVLDHIIHRARHPFSLPLGFPSARNRRFQQALKTLDQVVFAIIQDHRQRAGRAGDAHPDVLTMLLQARDEDTGAAMDDRQIRDEVITLIIAGHETVASALTWTWYLLTQNSSVESRLHHELDRVLAGHVPTSDDLRDLPLVGMIFQEALRLYPPAWMISRKALKEDFVSADPDEAGYTIEAGGLVVISPYVTHRHPQFWDQPEEFDPQRFSVESSVARPRFAYLPFGGGPRLCIGDRFAMLEAQLILATVSQQFQLGLAPNYPVLPEPLVTLRPRHGLWMILQRK